MNKFISMLRQDGPVILDGGLATQLESQGFDINGALWSAKLLVSNPRAIIDAHRAYLDAGADCIISASYQASRGGLMDLGVSATDADALIISSVSLAMTARAEFLADNTHTKREPLVAASIGPYGAAMNDGSEYTGDYDANDREVCEFHTERLKLLDRSGADVLAVETIPNAMEAAVLSELLTDTKTPAWISFSCRDGEHLSDGTRLADAVRLFASSPNVHAIGVNCTSPRYISALISAVKANAPFKAIVVYPNSGETYHSHNNSWSGSACDFERDFDVAGWRASGAKLIGGCCRTGPGDIAAMKEQLCQ